MVVRINIYGCSWSHGVPNVNSNRSWPEYFAARLPSNVTVRNFSFCGSSLDYSIYSLHKYKNSSIKEINIMQLTSSSRFCIWDHRKFTEKQQYMDSSNHWKFNYDLNNKYMLRIMPETVGEYKKYRAWFETSINYLDVQSKNLYIQRIAHVSYAVSHCDYVFLHRYDSDLGEFSLPSVDSQFDLYKFSEDNGFHFGEKGSSLVADMVYSNIVSKLNFLLE